MMVWNNSLYTGLLADSTSTKEYEHHLSGEATTTKEPGNEHNRYAVAVLEDETWCTVGQIGICSPTPILPTRPSRLGNGGFQQIRSRGSFESLDKYPSMFLLPSS